MSSSNQLPPLFDHLDLDETPTLGMRRALMEVFFRHHGRFNKEMMTAAREKAEEYMCLAIYGKKKKMISEEYFEYWVDITIWNNWSTWNDLGPHATPLPEWPWLKAKPLPFDMAKGISDTYALWFLSHPPFDEPSDKDEKAAAKAPAAGSSEQPPAAANDKPEPESDAAEP
ncbi:uncharacterized protein NECHADRAFT_83321 [Fusarium vanettenii 77-13-4]|uniref:Uncharacterized protein n=1 Tax=Fusarium vanettenii (strain ATCC MYA-4622 / CBS 123669 / FGSC 9596 / NRRL 45880 / 77-13-4) TaxID=660122 RepID=C7Z3P3_FUSV7|nr:uncharacterized protein NECHADRAFT_83321 [Fusarium vanettenii 77-13-4]EEU41343.1 predicted protein [Fusarium vanettenii 77-13-4]